MSGTDNPYESYVADDAESGIGHNSGDYADYVDTTSLDAVSADDKLAMVRTLAKLQVERQQAVTRAEAALKTAQIALASVAERQLPALLLELGVKAIPLTNGAKVELKTKIVASVKEEDRDPFFTWMHKHGYGTLVKRKVTTEFPRGDSAKARKLLGYLKRWYKDFVVVDNESIHAGTLNAWARELSEKNNAALTDGGKIVEFPEICKVTELRETVISLPKGKEVKWS